jgi:hypothetical protein
MKAINWSWPASKKIWRIFSAFLDRYGVADDRLKAEHAFIKLAGLVEVERRKAYMRESFV